MLAALDQQISQAQQHVKSINTQISQVSAQPASPAQQAKLSDSAGRAQPGDAR